MMIDNKIIIKKAKAKATKATKIIIKKAKAKANKANEVIIEKAKAKANEVIIETAQVMMIKTIKTR